MKKTATISPCKRYRYLLTREWDDGLPKLGFIMLNPSTADADIDDQTIRKCMGYARREGCGGIMVANLFGWRSTDPKVLGDVQFPRGVENEAAMILVMRRCDQVIGAWGASKFAPRIADRLRYLACEEHKTIHCLGVTQSGAPRHPLYLPLAVLIEVLWP